MTNTSSQYNGQLIQICFKHENPQQKNSSNEHKSEKENNSKFFNSNIHITYNIYMEHDIQNRPN